MYTHAHMYLYAPGRIFGARKSPSLEVKMSYAAAKKRAAPYTKIAELPGIETGDGGARQEAVAENRRAYVLVHSEGEGPSSLPWGAALEEVDGVRKKSQFGIQR